MPRDTLIAVIASVAIHLLLLGVLLFNFNRPPKVASMPEQPEIIQATVLGDFETPVDAERVRKEQEQQRQIEERQRQLQQEEEQRQAEITARAERERQAQEELKQAEADKKRKAEDERKKAEAEKQRKAEEEREKAEVEKQRKAEEERKKAEAEKQRKAEEERKKAEAEKERKAAEERLKQQLAAEQKRIDDEHAQELRKQQTSEWVNQYVASITAKIQRNWLRPLDSPEEFVCRVKVVQSPSGEVLDVQMIDSCGSALLDRSVENAVRKASPLPPPPDPSVFDREINIRFRPRG